MNASAVVGSRVATDQGDNIGRLTRVTVVCSSVGVAYVDIIFNDQAYLPLSLGTVRTLDLVTF